MSILSQAASVLFTATAAVGGEVVTISRGSVSTAGVTAIPSRPEYATDDAVASRLAAESFDWTLLASSYVISSVVVLPQEHDRVTRANGAIYELMEPPYRLSDAAGVRLRLHSKRVL